MEGTKGKETDRWGTADELTPLVANITGIPIDRTKITRIRGQRDDHPDKTGTTITTPT